MDGSAGFRPGWLQEATVGLSVTFGRNTDFRRGVVGIFPGDVVMLDQPAKPLIGSVEGMPKFWDSRVCPKGLSPFRLQSDYAKGLTMSVLSLRRLTSIERGRSSV